MRSFSENSIELLRAFAQAEFFRAGFEKLVVLVEPAPKDRKVEDQVILSVLQPSETLLVSETDACFAMQDVIRKTVARMKRHPAYHYDKVILVPEGYDRKYLRYGHKVFRTSHESDSLKWWNW